MNITYTVDCHCGEPASMTVFHADMDPNDITIDVEMTVGQAEFRCDDCGCITVTGDIETWRDTDERGRCEGDDDEDEEPSA